MKKILLLSLFLSAISNAQIVNIPDANFKARLMAATELNFLATDFSDNSVAVDTNGDSQIQMSEALNIKSLELLNANISDLTGIESFINLNKLRCDENSITEMNLSDLTNLTELSCGSNNIAFMTFPNLPAMKKLYINNNNMTNLDVSNLINLEFLYCRNNNLTSLDVSNLPNLNDLNCTFNQITSLDVSNSLNLTYLGIGQNPINEIDLSNLTNLLFFDCAYCPITELDFNNCTSLSGFYSWHCQQLTTILIKNGQNDTFNCMDCPNLQFVCVDDSQVEDIQALVTSWGLTSTAVSSYCSFVEGGDYNQIQGTVKFDADNVVCASSGIPSRFVRIGINDGSYAGTYFTNNLGNYTFYTLAGNFTLTPQMENSADFSFSPITATVNFPIVDNSISTNDFCVMANGIHPDVEVVIAPVGPARPGFDATYKIVYKNKGNQLISGAVALTFNDAVLDFVSSTPVPNIQALNSLTFNYSNLLPFENREILIAMDVNSPTDSPPVNNGDILNFTVTINPVTGDENLNDNFFVLNQTVINSYDPNDKTCLEGASQPVTEIGKYLHYIIRFENTGTAPAQNIIVADMINEADFDLSSLQIMNSSHPMEAKITDNKVEFIFEGINLPSRYADPIGGHGNVLFKVKTLSTLQAGDTAENQADIYFDYNFPIETNIAQTTFQVLRNTGFTKDESISIYPNPANDVLKIKADSSIQSVQLFDVQGRILQTSIENKNDTKIDISAKQNGIYFIKIMTEKGSKVVKIIKD